MASPQGQAFEDLRNTISECVRIVRHRWRLAVVGVTVVSSAAFWYSQYLPREYTASTLFERRDDVVLQNVVQSSRSPYSFERLKTTIALDMTGSRALAQALVKMGLVAAESLQGAGALSEDERATLDGVLGRYKLRPAVRLVHSSAQLDQILLRCEANDPDIARDFVVTLRDNYITHTRDRIRDILHDTKAFFEAEVARLRAGVAETDANLLKGFEDFPSIDPTDIVSVGNRLETLRVQHNGNQQRIAELEAQVRAREDFLVSAPKFFADLDRQTAEAPAVASAATMVDPALDKSIETVQKQIVELVTAKRMTMQHPEVRAAFSRLEALEDLRETVVSSLAELEPAERAQVARAPSEVLLEWQAQRMRVELELDSLRRQLEVAAAQLDNSEKRVQRVAGLYDQLLDSGDDLRRLREKRNEGVAELAIWQRHLSQLDRVLTAETGERGTQFTLIEEPKDNRRPTHPRIGSIFVVCSGLGLAAAALLVALCELFDRSFRSVGQVTRQLGIPVLECISVIATPKERRRAMLSRLVWTPTLATLTFALVVTAVLAYASIARPGLHRRAMDKVDRVLDTVGLASVAPRLDPPA